MPSSSFIYAFFPIFAVSPFCRDFGRLICCVQSGQNKVHPNGHCLAFDSVYPSANFTGNCTEYLEQFLSSADSHSIPQCPSETSSIFESCSSASDSDSDFHDIQDASGGYHCFYYQADVNTTKYVSKC